MASNDGLPIFECPELYPDVQEGDSLRIDLAASKIHLRDKQYAFPQLPDSVKKILELGGLANYLKTQLAGS